MHQDFLGLLSKDLTGLKQKSSPELLRYSFETQIRAVKDSPGSATGTFPLTGRNRIAGSKVARWPIWSSPIEANPDLHVQGFGE